MFSQPVFACTSLRLTASQEYYQPIVVYSEEETERIPKRDSVEELPPNLQLLSLRRETKDTIILRLEHIFQIGEHPTLSQPASCRLSKFLTGLDVAWIRETQLGADRWLNNEQGGELNNEQGGKLNNEQRGEMEDDLVTLQPMEIRTFIVKIQT